jgi:hypothetical protein
MRTKSEIEKLAYETLNSIGDIQQVEANPFLFAKIQARMEAATRKQNYIPVKTLSVLSATLLLFIGLNMASYFLLSGSSQQQASVTQQSTSKKTTVAEAFAKQYNLTTEQYNY